jgi:hypothetical protein
MRQTDIGVVGPESPDAAIATVNPDVFLKCFLLSVLCELIAL